MRKEIAVTDTQLVPNSTRSLNPRNLPFEAIPQSIDAEKALLGALLINPVALEDVRDLLESTDFFLLRHGYIFSVMCKLDDDDVELDLITLGEGFTDAQLKEIGGLAYIAELTNSVPTSLNVLHYADIVRRTARRRDLMAASDHLFSLAQDERLTDEQILDEIDMRLDGLRTRLPEPDARHVSEGIDRAKMHVADVIEGTKNTYIPTGIRRLDQTLGGGLGLGELAVVIAQRHMGKTSLAFNIARAAQQADVPTLYCSVEFGYDKVLRQYIAFDCGIPSVYFERGTANAEQYTIYSHAADRVKQQPLYIQAKQPVTMNKVAKKIRQLTRGDFPLELVIIDFVQGLSVGQNNVTAKWGLYQKMEYWTNAFVQTAVDKNVAILAMTQANRKSEGRMPEMADIEGGDYIAQRADVVIGMHIGKDTPDMLDMKVHKNRVTGEKALLSVTLENGTRRIK
jgi:replicative DNA helicase